MKKYFLLFIFSLSYCFGFAQNDQGKDYKWGIGIQVNQIRRISQLDENLYAIGSGGITKDKSFSLGVTPCYYLNKDFALQIRCDITKINMAMTNYLGQTF